MRIGARGQSQVLLLRDLVSWLVGCSLACLLASLGIFETVSL